MATISSLRSSLRRQARAALAALAIPLTLVDPLRDATLSASVQPSAVGSAIVGGDVSESGSNRPDHRDILGWLAWLIDGAETYPAQQPAAEEPPDRCQGRLGAAPGDLAASVRASACRIAAADASCRRDGTASRIGRSRGPASASQHAAWWPGHLDQAALDLHRSNASGQRGWKRHRVDVDRVGRLAHEDRAPRTPRQAGPVTG
jgi:hypothetical protein